MELIDIRDEEGRPTGHIKDREEIHRDGDLHATSHVWIVNNEKDSCRILLQKRSKDKDAYPGCYDISSAGHIPAGEDYLPSALRELKEELGIEAEAGDLISIGQVRYHFTREFHGKIFYNYEISRVYIYQKPVEIADLTLQEEEVEEVRWMDLEECMERVLAGDDRFCVMAEELEMIRNYRKSMNHGQRDGKDMASR